MGKIHEIGLRQNPFRSIRLNCSFVFHPCRTPIEESKLLNEESSEVPFPSQPTSAASPSGGTLEIADSDESSSDKLPSSS